MKLEERASLFTLENTWIIFMLLLVTSFYWWGRITVGVLHVPLVAFIVPFIGVVWFFYMPFSGGSNKDNIFLKKFLIPLVVMLWGMISSLLDANNLKAAIGVLSEMLFYIFMYFLIIKTVYTAQAINRITVTLILGITYLALEGLFKFFITKSIWRLGAGDVLTATNLGAFMFQGAIILLLAKILFKQWKSLSSRLFFSAILCILLVAFVFTYSRGAWLTIIVGGAILVRYKKVLIFTLLLLPPLFVFLFPGAVVNRAISILDFSAKKTVVLESDNYAYRSAEIKNTTSLRLKNWGNSINDICKHPFLGIGIGSYHGDAGEKGDFAPHNAYLRIWAECGPVAIIGFLWFLCSLGTSLFYAIRHTQKAWRWLSIGYLAIFVTHICYMLLGDWPYQTYFWVFAGLATVSVKVLDPNYHYK